MNSKETKSDLNRKPFSVFWFPQKGFRHTRYKKFYIFLKIPSLTRKLIIFHKYFNVHKIKLLCSTHIWIYNMYRMYITTVPVVAVSVGVPLLREAAQGSLSRRPGSTPGYWYAAAASPPAAREGWGPEAGLDTEPDGQLTCNKENQVTKADIEKLCEFLSMLFKRWIKHSPCQLHRYPANSFAFCNVPIIISSRSFFLN